MEMLRHVSILNKINIVCYFYWFIINIIIDFVYFFSFFQYTFGFVYWILSFYFDDENTVSKEVGEKIFLFYITEPITSLAFNPLPCLMNIMVLLMYLISFLIKK